MISYKCNNSHAYNFCKQLAGDIFICVVVENITSVGYWSLYWYLNMYIVISCCLLFVIYGPTDVNCTVPRRGQIVPRKRAIGSNII